MGFTDFFKKEILTNLISFSSSYTFSLDSLNLLLKASVVWAKNYEFLHFFLRGRLYWFRDLSVTSELKFITKLFSASTWFIHFDGLCNYLHSFQKHPAISLKINATFLIRNTLAIRITNFLKQDLTFHQIPFKGHLIRILLPWRHICPLLVVVAIVVVVVEVVVVAVVVVVVDWEMQIGGHNRGQGW